MEVDSYRFLPRSFRARYESPARPAGEAGPVWAPFPARLAESRVALLSSAGLYLGDSQEPFDADGERANPGWGDPSWRPIPRDTPQGDLAMMHLHVNSADVLADHEVALPLRALGGLVEAGVVGAAADTHFSVMGYQEEGLAAWRERTAPEIVSVLRDERVDGVVLAPV
jgi:D-proline reductase (dithiol) PrdB